MAYTEASLTLPGRPDDMPSLFVASNHPSLATVPSYAKRNTYIGHMNTSPAAMQHYLEYEKSLKCPEGSVADWKAQGLLELEPGDYLFLRDMKNSGTLTEDILKSDVLAAMVSGWFHHEGHERDAFDAATQSMLGPRNQRTPDSTAFEDTGCARKIRKKRCYSAALAIQQSRRVVAPTASLDQDRPNMDRYQAMTKALVDSTATMLLNVQDLLPEDCLEAFEANTQLSGQPSVGLMGVLGTGSIQVNISAAGLSASDNRLANQLGDFGCEHFDRTDSPDHLTTMFANPDIPATYQSGAFHILQLGVFVVLNKFVGVTFSGRRRHVGTASTPPPGSTAVPYAYRFNVVWYPKEAAVDGLSRWTLASLPGRGSNPISQKDADAGREASSESVGKGKKKKTTKKVVPAPEPLYLTPEMINLENASTVARTTNRATFARSGGILMDRQSHMNFMGRSLHLVGNYVWRQLPPAYDIRIDVNKLLEAVTYADEADSSIRHSLLPWASAPNVSQVSDERKENQSIWTAYQKRVRQFIPHIAGRLTGKQTDDSDTDSTDIELDAESGGEDLGSESHSPERVTALQNKANSRSGRSGKGSGFGKENLRTNGREKATGSSEVVQKAGRNEISDQGSRKGKGKAREVLNVSSHGEDHDNPQEESGDFVPRQVPASGRKALIGIGEASSSKRQRDLADNSASSTTTSTKRPRLITSIPIQSGPTSSEDFPFLQGLTLEAMHQEFVEIEREATLGPSYQRTVASQFHLPHLLAASSSLVIDPVSGFAPVHVRQLIVQVRNGLHSEMARAIDARWERYSILMSSIRIWYWLDVTIRDATRDIFNSPSKSRSGWLATMVEVATMYLKSKNDNIKFDPTSYPAFLALRSCPIVVPNRHRKFFSDDPESQAALREAVIQTIRAALMQSLDFPQDASMMDRRRAWLIGTLADVVGPNFLATRHVWNAWVSFVVKDYFPSSNKYKDDSELIEPFRRALKLHPICREGSPMRELFMRFGQRFQSLTPPVPRPLNAGIMSSPGQFISSPSLHLESQASRLILFLRASLRFIDGSLPSQHPVHRLLSKNLDFYLPFREKAPSRIRIRTNRGPFSPARIRTTSGLFSAVVFRGITYNTPFSLHPDAPMDFLCDMEFEIHVDAFRERHPTLASQPNFFCNPNAYSRQPITARSLDNAHIFWETAKNMGWPKKIAQTVISFERCLGILADANFPTMGRLCLFLLAGDLHYAGVCEPPGFPDVADFLFRRKPTGGSLKGLVALNLVPDAWTTSREEIEGALRMLDAYLKTVFTEEERSRMGFDLICLEHLLCKYNRALNEGALAN